MQFLDAFSDIHDDDPKMGIDQLISSQGVTVTKSPHLICLPMESEKEILRLV